MCGTLKHKTIMKYGFPYPQLKNNINLSANFILCFLLQRYTYFWFKHGANMSLTLCAWNALLEHSKTCIPSVSQNTGKGILHIYFYICQVWCTIFDTGLLINMARIISVD